MRVRAVLAAAGVAAAGFGAGGTATAAPPAPLDPQNWSFQDNLTWADYKKLPGPDYSDPSIQPTVKKWKVAIVLADFKDRPFIVTQPAGSTIWGTPTATANSVPRAAVPQFYADFLNKPSATNNFQTMNRYWMEDSFGKYGVEPDALRPVQARPQRVRVLHLGLRRHGAEHLLPDAHGDAVQPQHPHRPAGGLGGGRR